MCAIVLEESAVEMVVFGPEAGLLALVTALVDVVGDAWENQAGELAGVSGILCKRQPLGSCALVGAPAFTVPLRPSLSFGRAGEDHGQSRAQRARQGLALTAAGVGRIHHQKGEGGLSHLVRAA